MSRRWWSGILALLLAISMVEAAFGIDKATLRLFQRKPAIRKIYVEGNSFFSEGDIKGRMYSKERSVWRAIKGDRASRLQRETLNRDTLEIMYLYYTEGFLGVRVTERFEPTDDGAKVDVRISIDEGRRYLYGPIRLAGEYPHAFTFHFDKLARRLKPGKPVNPLQLRETTFEMKTYMANHGYPYANVDWQADTVGCEGECPLTFVIRSDSAVVFGDVTVEGSKHFPGYVARRELTIRPGQTYRRDDIIETQRRLLESGYFSSFSLLQSENSADRLRPDFTLRLRERKTMYSTFTLGAVGQSETADLLWTVAGGFGKRNLFGSRRLDVSAEYYLLFGTESRLTRHVYGLKFTEPWFLGIRMPLILAGEFRPKVRSEKLTEDIYDVQTWSASASTIKYFGRDVRTELGFEYESVEISGISEDEIPRIKERDGQTARRRLYLNYRRDSRDNLFIPTRGTVAEFSGQYVGGFLGGDADFVKIQGSLSRYQVIWPGWISATRVKAGWVDAFGETEVVPAEDRFYIGGASSVRGFRERSLGPVAGDTAIGARYMIILNQEFRWKTLQVLNVLPLLGKFFERFPLYQSVFFDMGNGFDAFDEIDVRNYAYSYGTGIQFASPAGPIRVDYARRIKTDRYSEDYRWHFTILYAF